LKNRCFNSSLSEKDLADLAFNGLRSYLKEKLEGFDFITVNHLQMRAIGVEFKYKNSKDSFKPHRSNPHVVENDSDCTLLKRECTLLNLFGHQRTNLLHVLRLSRFKRIGRMR